MRNSIVSLLYLLCFKGYSQFKYQASLQRVKKAGFYRIEVTPVLSSYIKTDFSDLRIFDDANQPVPYILSYQPGIDTAAGYMPYNIVENGLDDSARNIVIIGNKKKAGISSISLDIRNNSVKRMVDITGSDDKLHWYSILENGVLERKFVNDTDRYMQDVSFPQSSYKYIKLVIYNGKNAPLNIISAGWYLQTLMYEQKSFINNPQSVIKQVDSSDGQSYIFVHDSMPFHKTIVAVNCAAPKFSSRVANIIAGSSVVGSIRITSGAGEIHGLPSFRERDWHMVINNGDNPPLKVLSITTAQETPKIVAWLEPDKQYRLEMNDSLAVAPVYDLEKFKDSIPKNIDEIKYSDIQPINGKAAAQPSTFFKQSWLWPVMIAGLAILVLFTWRLTKEMRVKE